MLYGGVIPLLLALLLDLVLGDPPTGAIQLPGWAR